jgi:hypothetical protein
VTLGGRRVTPTRAPAVLSGRPSIRSVPVVGPRPRSPTPSRLLRCGVPSDVAQRLPQHADELVAGRRVQRDGREIHVHRDPVLVRPVAGQATDDVVQALVAGIGAQVVDQGPRLLARRARRSREVLGTADGRLRRALHRPVVAEQQQRHEQRRRGPAEQRTGESRGADGGEEPRAVRPGAGQHGHGQRRVQAQQRRVADQHGRDPRPVAQGAEGGHGGACQGGDQQQRSLSHGEGDEREDDGGQAEVDH